ncbi:MAG: periplasmic heavy metal sensor [Syntrophorhabdaceae bacterium]|nr:periplasmic heavy metal sensor [Syntrophorhabdaceae bacterium]
MGARESMTFLVSFLFLCLFITPSLRAQNSYSEFERGLQLSDPQRTQVEDIRNRYINEWQSLRRESSQKRSELRELSRNPEANSARIGRIQGEIQELDTARRNSYQQYRSEVSRTLNQTQRQRYNSFCNQEQRKNIERFRQRRHGR